MGNISTFMENSSILIPTGINVKSAIRFSMSLMILSRPLLKNIPELVRTLQKGDN